MCAGNFVLLFVAIAQVRCHSVKCGLFEWSVIEHIALNGEVQNSVYSQIDSVYRLTALHDGINRLVLYTRSISPEHLQVSAFNMTIYYVNGRFWQYLSFIVINVLENLLYCSGVWKTKNRFGFSLKNRTVQKFESCSDGFCTETVCSPQCKLKVTKITLLAFSG